MFTEKIHRYIYLFGLFCLAFGMMVGTVPTSVPQLVLMGNWLLEMDFKRKWQQLKTNRLFWVLAAVYFVHVLGLLYTHDLGDGLKDIRTKLPLLFLPLLFLSSRPLQRDELHRILFCFIAGCVVNTLWCFLYSFVIHHTEVVRNASRFMSHIRLGLYLNIAISACVYFVFKLSSVKQRWLFASLAVYFTAMLYVLGLATGVMNFILLVLGALGLVIYRQRLLIKLPALFVLLAFLAMVLNYVYDIKVAQLDVKQTPNNQVQEFSPSGRAYLHFEKGGQKENGNYIQINIQPEELQREWKREFPEDSFNYAQQSNLKRYEVLIRYMASKGLNKDSAAYAQLTASDKKNIKKNSPNYQYSDWSFLHKRTYELVNEYDDFRQNRVVSGHSLTMRLYFWKAAWHLVKQNPLLGIGTGDVQDELNKTYVETNSPLEKEWHKRPHNQFLTIQLALGIPGLTLFVFSLLFPFMYLRKQLPKLYWPFFFIVFISFFLEDTLETQAGLSFYAFFNTLFLSFAWWKKQAQETQNEL